MRSRALAQAAAELVRVGDALRAEGRADEAEIVETGVLMAEDPALAAELERAVLDAGRPAPGRAGRGRGARSRR